MALEPAFLLSRVAGVLGTTQGPCRESNDICVTSGGLPKAWVTWFNTETCLGVLHLQIAMCMSWLL